MGFFTKLVLGTGVYIGCLVSFNRYYAPSKVPDSPPVPAARLASALPYARISVSSTLATTLLNSIYL